MPEMANQENFDNLETNKTPIKPVIKKINRNVDIKYPVTNVYDSLKIMKTHAKAKFDETVDIAVKLNVDPRKPNQSIKSTAKLPFGTGKKVRVAVFATGEDAQLARDAGADIVGGEDLIKIIQGGEIAFDRAISTPEMMSSIVKIGKVSINFISFHFDFSCLSTQLYH